MIVVEILTRNETMEWPVGHSFLSALLETDEALRPDEYTINFGSFKKTWAHPFIGVEECRENWAYMADFAWMDRQTKTIDRRWKSPLPFTLRRRKQIRYTVDIDHMFFFDDGRRHTGCIYGSFANSDKIDWRGLFRLWCDATQPHLGMLHPLEKEPSEKAKDGEISFRTFGSTENPKIEEFAWAMAFGQEFAENFPEEALRRDGFSVERLKNCVLLTLTDDIRDVKKRYDYFCERRALAKSHFPEGFTLY